MIAVSPFICVTDKLSNFFTLLPTVTQANYVSFDPVVGLTLLLPSLTSQEFTTQVKLNEIFNLQVDVDGCIAEISSHVDETYDYIRKTTALSTTKLVVNPTTADTTFDPTLEIKYGAGNPPSQVYLKAYGMNGGIVLKELPVII